MIGRVCAAPATARRIRGDDARSGIATTGCSSPARPISLVGTWMQQVAQAWLVLS